MKKVDCLAPQIGLSYKGNSRYQTKFGGVLTIILAVLAFSFILHRLLLVSETSNEISQVTIPIDLVNSSRRSYLKDNGA